MSHLGNNTSLYGAFPAAEQARTRVLEGKVEKWGFLLTSQDYRVQKHIVGAEAIVHQVGHCLVCSTQFNPLYLIWSHEPLQK